MNHSLLFLLTPFILLFLTAAARSEQVSACGMEEVFIVDLDQAAKGKFEKLWSWTAKSRADLPENMRDLFRTTSDCKPADGGARILICASGGGCVVVERPSGRVLWYAQVPNAHSMELLPRDRIVVASSHKPNGDRLVLFDLSKSNQPIMDTPLSWAHGVVWDDGRKCLWALGDTELRSYELKDWDTDKPSLVMKGTYQLPENSGHELQPVPNSDDLVLSTATHVHLFDRHTLKFRPHPDLADVADVKCVSMNPATGRTIFLHGEDKHWWSSTLHLLYPAGEIKLQDERLYKVRWMPPAPAK